MTKNEIKNIKFVVRTDVDENGENTYGVLQVRNVGDEINVSELEVNPYEIDELIKLLEATKELIFKESNK